jgi:NDP-sugar pyrophosphorylase family protein
MTKKISKRAIILAGGKGSRLRPYTVVLPKPLMPIGDYPILELVVRQLIKNNFNHITMCVNHQADLIKTFFGDGERWGIKIDYSNEYEPLGTMGPLKQISDLPNNFLVMNGDILTNLNFESFHNDHVRDNEIYTISSYKRSQRVDYGVLECSKDDYLESFQEKPTNDFKVSMGIYMLNKKVLDFIPSGFYGFDSLMYKLIKSKNKVKVKEFNGYWLDIGRPDDYIKAIEDFESMKNMFL